MSKAWDRLKTLGIGNPVEAVQYAANRGVGPSVYVHYRSATPHARIWPAWQVLRPGYKTDRSNLATMDYQQWTLGVHGDRAARLEEAKAWASARYGIAEWGTIPGLPGEYFPKAVADLIKTDLKNAAV